jgi:hypothetical protein
MAGIMQIIEIVIIIMMMIVMLLVMPPVREGIIKLITRILMKKSIIVGI